MPVPWEYNLKSLLVRRVSTLLTLAGIALVAVIFVVVMGLAHGLRQVFTHTGSHDNLIFVRAGASNPLVSRMGEDELARIGYLPEIAHDDRGRPLLSAEIVEYFSLGDRRVPVAVRGVDPAALELRRGVEIAEGRLPDRLSEEVVLGAGLAREAGVGPGDTLKLGKTRWRVVGLLRSPGLAYEAEAWIDRLSLMRERQRLDFNYVIARVVAPDLEASRRLEKRWEGDPALGVRILVESDYYSTMSGMSSTFELATWILVAVMGLAMVITGTNTMYGILALRQRELGALRVFGFRGRDILLGVLAEAAAIGLAGGVVGGLAACLANGAPFAYEGVQYSFRIGPVLLARGVLIAALLGTLGGLLPAVRAARLEAVTALRTL
jgi:ABC-type antimicrobial peptide transport system permease subunit